MPPPQYQPKQLVYVVTCEEVARWRGPKFGLFWKALDENFSTF
jgi:hypothetical protein